MADLLRIHTLAHNCPSDDSEDANRARQFKLSVGLRALLMEYMAQPGACPVQCFEQALHIATSLGLWIGLAPALVRRGLEVALVEAAAEIEHLTSTTPDEVAERMARLDPETQDRVNEVALAFTEPDKKTVH